MSRECSKCHTVKEDSEFYTYNYVTSNVCKVCKKAYIKEWANKPERKAIIHDYKTSEEYKAYNAKYRLEHAEELKGKVYNIDKARRKAYLEKYNKEYREKNKEELKAKRTAPEYLERRASKQRERYAQDPGVRAKISAYGKTEGAKTINKKSKMKCGAIRRQWVAELKANMCCYVCGERDSRVLDFHHIDDSSKEFEIAQAVGKMLSKERILAEAAKCRVYCANHHALETHRLRILKQAQTPVSIHPNYLRLHKYKSERREWLRTLKTSKGCCVCGEKNPMILDFHHKDKATKQGCLGNAVYWSWDRIKAEAELCNVYCKNHHRLEHKGNKWADIEEPVIPPPSLDTSSSPAILPLTDPVIVQSIKEDPDHGRIRPEALSTVGPAPR